MNASGSMGSSKLIFQMLDGTPLDTKITPEELTCALERLRVLVWSYVLSPFLLGTVVHSNSVATREVLSLCETLFSFKKKKVSNLQIQFWGLQGGQCKRPNSFKVLLFLYFLLNIILLLYVYECFAHIYVRVPLACLVPVRGQKRASEHPKLELCWL